MPAEYDPAMRTGRAGAGGFHRPSRGSGRWRGVAIASAVVVAMVASLLGVVTPTVASAATPTGWSGVGVPSRPLRSGAESGPTSGSSTSSYSLVNEVPGAGSVANLVVDDVHDQVFVARSDVISVYDLEGDLLGVIGDQQMAGNLAIVGTTLYVDERLTGTIHRYSTETGEDLGTLATGLYESTMALHPLVALGDHLYMTLRCASGCSARLVQVSLSNGAVTEVTTMAEPYDLAPVPGQQKLLYGGPSLHEVDLSVDPATVRTAVLGFSDPGVSEMVVEPGGATALTLTYAGVRRFSLADLLPVSSPFAMGQTTTMALSDEQTGLLAVGTGVQNRNVQVVRVADGQEVFAGQSIPPDFGDPRPHTFAFSPEGRRVYSVTDGSAWGEAVVLHIDHPLETPGGFHPVSPSRVLDTRIGQGAAARKLHGAETIPVTIGGLAGVPTEGVSAVVLNLTATSADRPGVLTVFPDGFTRPLASNLNFGTGQTAANAVTVAMVDGKVDIYNDVGNVDVVADVQGWYDDGTTHGDFYNPLPPARLLDTRTGNGAPVAEVGPQSSIELQVTGRGAVPASGVSAVTLNVTATDVLAGTFVTVWPGGSGTPPVASNLNLEPGETRANLVTVPVGPGGTVRLFNAVGGINLVADVVGWYDTTGVTGEVFRPVEPTRMLDSRTNQAALAGGGTWFLQTHTLEEQQYLPLEADALVLNVTAVDPTQGSFLTVFPNNAYPPVVPTASTVNFAANHNTPNATVVGIGLDGYVDIHNDRGAVHLVVDLAGYFIVPAIGTR